MRSSDRTHYNLRRLHVVFAGSSLALVVATAWMIWADHDRPWKPYQRTYRQRIEPWWTERRLEAARRDARHAEAEQWAAALARQEPTAAKRALEMPILDALGRPLAIEQIWLPELGIDYHFGEVARFDRCVTCHQGIAASPPAPASPAALGPPETVSVELVVSQDAEDAPGKRLASDESRLAKRLGLVLAPRGMLDEDAATIAWISKKSPAARARLQPGDVIIQIDGKPASGRADVVARLGQALASTAGNAYPGKDGAANSQRTIALGVRRGLAQPYRAHPRPDLMVGPESPHPAERFGCTICHDGQGSATEFRFASHTPDDPSARRRWRDEHGWFDNADWPYPMLPRRFAESRCLRCHHDVVDLEPSERFRDPPAPKLVAGYHLVRQHGCFGCHEILGYSPSGQSVGPDMRLEPDYAGAAAQLASQAALDNAQRRLAQQVARRPDDSGTRRELVESLREQGTPDKLAGPAKALVELLASNPSQPGTMRKVGPSLRHVAGRLDAAFIESWLRRPSAFRPKTRMPQLFDLHEHLQGSDLAKARRLEAVEIHAIGRWLLEASGPLPPVEAPRGVTEPPSPQRGRRLFATQGCLACHQHEDFPEGQATQGADLSRLGAKYTSPRAAAWLVDWLRDPSRYGPRTLMPNPLLAPAPLAGQMEPATDRLPRMTDPAADLAAFLLESNDGTPEGTSAPSAADLDELALVYLSKAFPQPQAEEYLRQGIPASMADRVSGDAAGLLGPASLAKKLRYVARRSIARRGCFGCHDVPGFETAQRIGPALSAWGRKDTSLLAFNQVDRLVAQHAPEGPDEGYYRDALAAGRREGFLWQKLRDPRSFDYAMTAQKTYDEQLTMGRFTMTPEEREAVATFVLGLVAQPPATEYVHKPVGPRRAIVEGSKVLTKYACAECHVLGMERWQIELDPNEFEAPAPLADFDFLRPRVPPERLAASRACDLRGLARAELVGMAQVDSEGKPVVLEGDEEDSRGEPLPMYAFSLWEPAVIAGEVCTTGGADVLVVERQIVKREPAQGGALARLLYPRVMADARAAGITTTGMEAWGWGPPPLVGEGRAVEPAWLHAFLLEPAPIRPAAVLRMPRYNLSSDEARRLVEFFAARDGAEYPYSTPQGGLAAAEDGAPPLESKLKSKRYDEAMQVVLDRKTFCAKCHLVGDYRPKGDATGTLGPNLANAGRRLRPEYIRRWLAHPQAVRPYTPMPVNFPPTGDPLGQDLLRGTSLEQIDAVSELLRRYESYQLQRTSVRAMIE